MANEQQKTPGHSIPDASEEAKNLAKEAMQEKQHGNREEGEFLMDEARKLDKTAAEKVTHQQAGKSRAPVQQDKGAKH